MDNTMRPMKKIPLDELSIERLSKKHTAHLESFICFEKELVDFLNEDALSNEEKRISVTHLWLHQSRLVGYLTLLTDNLSLSAPLKEKFRKEGIEYKSLPALKIGRLCVDDRFARMGIGTYMVDFVIRKMAQTNEYAGCRFITLDAKQYSDTKKDPRHFYKKMEFEVLKERKKGTIPMYKDCSKLIAQLRQRHPSS